MYQCSNLQRFVVVLATVCLARGGHACTMPLPTPEPEFEWEIEIEFEDYNSADDIAYYKIEIETQIMPPTLATQCQCGIGLGTTANPIPLSFDVFAAAVGVRGSEDFDLEEFAGFSGDQTVSNAINQLTAGATGFGFSTLVQPFDPLQVSPGDTVVLSFLIGFDPDDFDEVNGSTIRFAAGSTDPGHAVSVFDGYQATLNLPPIHYDGDFNGDGMIDIADYTVWRDTLGSTTDLAADADDSGDVDEEDYRRWRANFGRSNGGGGNLLAVPEPATLSMLLIAVSIGLFCRARI